MRRVPFAALAALLTCASLASAQAEKKVTAPTRLDWEFAVQGFGPGAAKLPAAYDSTQQRYQLYVPKKYDAKRAWPLVLFISAGDQAAGWSAWQKVCEEEGVFFCAPYAAGNNVPAGQRTRIVLDALDDVRRAYRIDADQTYLTGFSGGARMACAIGFALPEAVGGIAPLCGTNPISGPTYLRHRAQDRLSVALVTGETDFNRKENEDYMAPWLKELGVRSKLWVVPKMGHAVPSAVAVRDVYAWLKDDLPRRRADAKARPELVLAPDAAAAGPAMAQRLVAAAKAELKDQSRTWRGVALLQGAAQRGGKSEAGKMARQLLKDITADEAVLTRIAEQGGKDERLALSAQARALELFGQVGKAIDAWALLAKNQPGTDAAKEADEQMRRLSKQLPAAYLGVGLDGTTVEQLAPQGPAAKAGLKVGDVLTKIGDKKVAGPDDLRTAAQNLKPGDRLRIEVRRGGATVAVTIEVGTRPLLRNP